VPGEARTVKVHRAAFLVQVLGRRVYSGMSACWITGAIRQSVYWSSENLLPQDFRAHRTVRTGATGQELVQAARDASRILLAESSMDQSSHLSVYPYRVLPTYCSTILASPSFLACLAHWDLESSLMADNLAHPYKSRRKSLVVHWHHLPTTAG
jgi:hypothetical protein